MIPVHGPDDPEGFADLYKHPGILDFSQPFAAFEQCQLAGVRVSALPLTHSKPTFGYLFESEGRRLAYLTDTVGVPAASEAHLLAAGRLDVLVLDCSTAPQPQAPRNHNDLTRALQVIERLQPSEAVLTHIGHSFDAWLLEHPEALPAGI
ncbi:phosphonate metabolism protein PhnP [Pseudomonas sp. SJZ079]|nr:phosphonate metabolism protein PhnP [Pseudomonas sp. SJZ079]